MAPRVPSMSILNGIFFPTSELPLLAELTNTTTTEGSQVPQTSKLLSSKRLLAGGDGEGGLLL